MKLSDAKKQCITYRAIRKIHIIKENFEDFEVFHRVFLHLRICRDLLKTSLIKNLVFCGVLVIKNNRLYRIKHC